MKQVRPYVPKRLRSSDTSADQKHQSSDVWCKEGKALDAEKPKPNSEIDRVVCASSSNLGQSKEILPNSVKKNAIPKSCIVNLKIHKNSISCLRWAPNENLLLSASLDSTIKVLDYADGRPRTAKTINSHTGAVKDARWNVTGSEILSGGYDKCARIINAENGKEISSFKHKDFVTSVLYHPENSNVFLSGTSSSGVYAWDVRSNEQIHHYKSFFGQVHDLLFHPDGKTFFSAAEILKRNSMDRAIIAWDFDTTAIMSNQISQEPFTCNCLQIHPFEDVFLAQYASGYITIFSSSSPYKLNKYKRFEGHQTAGFRIGFTISPDGCKVISGDTEGEVHIYDYRSSKLLKTLNVFTSACMNVDFHPKLPSLVAMCSWDGEVSFWQ